MNQAAQKADPRLACLGCLLVLATSSIALAQQAQPPAPDPVVDEKPERVLDLTSPRATMREFLVAIQDADADHPERIDDAVECLDTSQLEVEHRAERARGLARRLHAVIDKAGVTLKDIPEGRGRSRSCWNRAPTRSDRRAVALHGIHTRVDSGAGEGG